MATLTKKQAALFTDRNWGVIATVREDLIVRHPLLFLRLSNAELGAGNLGLVPVMNGQGNTHAKRGE